MTIPPAQAADDDRPDRRPPRTGRRARLAKIEGQVRGLRKMCQAGTYCPDVVVQVASVTRRCRVAVGLLAGHLHHCVVNAAHASEDGGQASLGEVAGTIRQVIRI